MHVAAPELAGHPQEGQSNMIVRFRPTLNNGSFGSSEVLLLEFERPKPFGSLEKMVACPPSRSSPVCRTARFSGNMDQAGAGTSMQPGRCVPWTYFLHDSQTANARHNIDEFPVRLVKYGSNLDNNHTDHGESCGEATKATRARIELDRMRP